MKAFAEKTKQLITNRKGPLFDDDEVTTAYVLQKDIQSDLRRLLLHLDALGKAAEGLLLLMVLFVCYYVWVLMLVVFLCVGADPCHGWLREKWRKKAFGSSNVS
jgi:hypothetical protein